jgi:type I restriction enzyme M protein
MQTLSATLSAQMQKANELDEAIKLNLSKIGYEL